EAGRTAEAQDMEAREAAHGAFTESQAARDAQAALGREAAAQSARLAALVEQGERLDADLRDQMAKHAAGEEKFAQIADPSAAREKLVRDRATLAAERAKLSELQSNLHRL